MSYRFGTSAGKNWDGTEEGIRARAKKVRGVDGDEAVRYVQAYVDRQSAPGTDKAEILANNRGNPITADRPVVPTGTGSLAAQIATKPASKIKEPSFKMPFQLRSQELNILMQQREDLKRQAFITGGNPASAAYIESLNALGMNKAGIENMTQTQAINMMQINNDSRMMNELLDKQFPGRGVRISPNSDGTFRVEADGKVIGARVNKGKLISGMRRSNSAKLNAELKAAKSKAIIARDKALMDLQVAVIGKRWDQLMEREKNELLARGKFFNGPNGEVYTVINGQPTVLVMGETEAPDGEGPPIPTLKATTLDAGLNPFTALGLTTSTNPNSGSNTLTNYKSSFTQ